ncbi:MAG: type II toxin-antitoxin system VapC family toxin [Pseudomonadota bacterium]
MLYMLDTDISSYLIRKRPLEVLEVMQRKVEKGHDIVISVITYAELLFGAERSENPRKHRKIINEYRARVDQVLAWDADVAETFSRVKAKLFDKGTPIGGNDTMIAAHALSIGAVVVTNNEKHFKCVKGLTLENWVRR